MALLVLSVTLLEMVFVLVDLNSVAVETLNWIKSFLMCLIYSQDEFQYCIRLLWES